MTYKSPKYTVRSVPQCVERAATVLAQKEEKQESFWLRAGRCTLAIPCNQIFNQTTSLWICWPKDQKHVVDAFCNIYKDPGLKNERGIL